MDKVTIKQLLVILIILIALLLAVLTLGIIKYMSIPPEEELQVIAQGQADDITDSEYKSLFPEQTNTPMPSDEPIEEEIVDETIYPISGWTNTLSKVRSDPTTKGSSVVTKISNAKKIKLTGKVDGTDDDLMWYMIEYKDYE